MPDLIATNVGGTLNVLKAFEPARMVFASSSAVYGTVRDRRVRPVEGEAAATGAYGISKLMGEAVCSQWADERGTGVVALRLGNVVGPRCRGLIPYLVAHAIRHPDGSVAARMRGAGRIVRDYVTVDCVVDALLKSAELPLEAGRVVTINVGSGRGMSNGEVAGLVSGVLERSGYALRVEFDDLPGLGESAAVVLDVEPMSGVLGVLAPDRETLERSIEHATLAHLKAMRPAVA
jgi:nucleoside-diphosphate-sugar epimerase